MRLNKYIGLWGRYILKLWDPLYFFLNTNTAIFVMFIPLLFDLLYQRGCGMQAILENKWKKGQSMRHLHPYTGYIPCISFYLYIFLLTTLNRASKAIYLDNKFKIFDLWGSYGLKQGNALQNLKTANQIIFVLSPALLLYLLYQKGYQIYDLLRIN